MLSDGFIGAVDNVVSKYSGESTVTSTPNTVEQNLEIFYKKLEDMGFDLTELKPILESKGSMLILAGAGVGKTTTLILKIIHDFISGEALKPVVVKDVAGNDITVMKPVRILMGTFLKSGADELRASFFDWCKKLGVRGISTESINFCTLHKEFIDAIKFFGGNVKIADDSFTTDVVRRLMRKYSIHQQGYYAKSNTVEEINDIKGLLTYYRNRLDSERIKHPLMREYNIDSAIFEQIVKEYTIELDAAGLMDFEMTQELLYKYMGENPAIRNALMNRYDFVYVDEFQDTSQLQYAILKAYFDGAMRVIVIGDDDQTIYSWRGSDINIISHTFEDDYHPTVMPLTSNHRCPANILQPVIPSIMENKNRHPKQLRSSKPGGSVNVVHNITQDDLIKRINEDLTKYETIGIISRTNNDLLIPAMLLEISCGVDFQTSKSVSLSSRMPKSICSSIDLITKRYNDSFESILKTILPRQFTYEITRLCDIIAMNTDITIMNIDIKDLEASTPGIAPFVRGLQFHKQKGDKEAFGYILDYMITQTFARDTNYCIKARTFTQCIKDLVFNNKATMGMDIFALDRLLNNELPARIAKRNKPIANPRIKLTTVHEAKGKEWDSVYIWNDVDGTFPSALSRQSEENEYEEERRLHYIAWTRAKAKLTVCTSTKNPSPFLLECTIPNTVVKPSADLLTQKRILNALSDSKTAVHNFVLKFVAENATFETEEDLKTREDFDILLGTLSVDDIEYEILKLLSTESIQDESKIRDAVGVIAQNYLDLYDNNDLV